MVHLMKLKVHANSGPSDYSDGVSIHKLSNKKVFIEKVDCFPIYILLFEIVNIFLISAILAASSAQ